MEKGITGKYVSQSWSSVKNGGYKMKKDHQEWKPLNSQFIVALSK